MKSFTEQYDKLSQFLLSEVAVGPGFDPDLASPPLPKNYICVWDTGATHSVVSQRVVDDLQLEPIGVTLATHVNGAGDVTLYLASMRLPNGVGFAGLTVTRGAFLDFDVLIGMDIIGAGDFAVSNFAGKTAFSYRYPSMGLIDFTEGRSASVAPPGSL